MLKKSVIFLFGFLALDIFLYLPGLMFYSPKNFAWYVVFALLFFPIAWWIVRRTGIKGFRSLGLNKDLGWHEQSVGQ